MKIAYLQQFLTLAVGGAGMSHPEPPAPALRFLYTAYVVCKNGLYESYGPRGIRTTIPIVGGNFTGPRMKGKIVDVGADWGLTDPQTGIFSADTRYNFLTDDGAYIFLQTSGPAQPNGNLHLRAIFETGSPKYYWLNNVVAIGILSPAGGTSPEGTFTLRIDTWDFASDYNSTTFANGTVAGP